jgi:hydroxymethylpyrimidine/phosphomethylpyrimidine kinase
MKVVVTIAGSDSGGGAGIQADLKTFEAYGVFGANVVSVLTAQNTKGVTDIFAVSPEFVKAQLDAVFDDYEVSAIKIGMLYSNEIIDVVREYIKGLDIPIVFDPVSISKAGSKLLQDDAIENLKSLFPFVTLITPNLHEAH